MMQFRVAHLVPVASHDQVEQHHLKGLPRCSFTKTLVKNPWPQPSSPSTSHGCITRKKPFDHLAEVLDNVKLNGQESPVMAKSLTSKNNEN